MLMDVIMGAMLAVQPASTAEIDYLPVTAAGDEVMPVVERLLADGAPGASRSSAAPDPLLGCLGNPLIDRTAGCVRRQLPAGEGGRPLVALLIHSSTVSNVTGSVSFPRYDLYCVGQRSVAVADLWNGRRPPPASRLERLREPIRACIAGAAAAQPLGGLALVATARWRVPWGAAAQDEALARGTSAEHAIVRFERIHRNCHFIAEVVEAERGERLRAGDRIEGTAPCPANSAVERRLTEVIRRTRRGAPVRLYLGYDGGVRFIAPM